MNEQLLLDFVEKIEITDDNRELLEAVQEAIVLIFQPTKRAGPISNPFTTNNEKAANAKKEDTRVPSEEKKNLDEEQEVRVIATALLAGLDGGDG